MPDATKPRAVPMTFKDTCAICGRRVPEEELQTQRGHKVCWRDGCKDEYNPRHPEDS